MIPILAIAPGCWDPDIVPANYGQWAGSQGTSDSGGGSAFGGAAQSSGGSFGSGGTSSGGAPSFGGASNGGSPTSGGSSSGGMPASGGSGSGGMSALGGSGSGGSPASGGSPGGDYPPPSSCLQTILTSCNLCHGAQAAAIGANLDLRGNDVASRLVDEPATYMGVTDADQCVQGAKLIDSANPAESVLLKKVKGEQECGTPMPAPTGLNAIDQACVEAWIESLF